MESSATVDGGSDLRSLLVCTFHTIKARPSSLCSSALCPEVSFCPQIMSLFFFPRESELQYSCKYRSFFGWKWYINDDMIDRNKVWKGKKPYQVQLCTTVKLDNKELFGRPKIVPWCQKFLTLWSKRQICQRKWFLDTYLFFFKSFFIPVLHLVKFSVTLS